MRNILSDAFLSGLKRQAVLKLLALLIDALIDIKQTYANRTSPNTTNTPPNNDLNPHL